MLEVPRIRQVREIVDRIVEVEILVDEQVISEGQYLLERFALPQMLNAD